ncbi:DDE-Tnp-1-7 domain-containing protein [Fusarium falciforme]|uniref:DDE-Tnp-1-7 domain-containing protein n=1 Tax=Fusarium falciforme TaxID=195108 RepID=UPI002301EF2B|nr:DDE-Tnp-1-7 domain-containing protein [Fusarium falciforme]WAO97213.1 DDE-Tnp-1-7 domain-containing protein [Fusarium falciforme]
MRVIAPRDWLFQLPRTEASIFNPSRYRDESYSSTSCPKARCYFSNKPRFMRWIWHQPSAKYGPAGVKRKKPASQRGRRKGKGRGSQRRAPNEVDEVKEVIHAITEAGDKIMALNSTQSVVIALINLLPESTYHVFVDNLFSSPDLFRSLRPHGHGATGTARPNCGIYKGLADAKKADKAGKSGFQFSEIKVIPTADNQVN